MIDLHYWPTPNGKKVTILLEEAAIPYRIVDCNIGRGDQFTEEFLRINPNNRMPAMVDTAPADGGEPISIFESGAIMIYLAEKVGRFTPADARGKAKVLEWVMWQMANQGPKMGENGHFRRLDESKGDQSYALRRFGDETNRIYGVMNGRLYESPYLAGCDYTIADMICYPWAAAWEFLGQDIAEFPHVKRWLDELAARPAVQRGMAAVPHNPEDMSKLSPEEMQRRMKLLYNQRARPVPVPAP